MDIPHPLNTQSYDFEPYSYTDIDNEIYAIEKRIVRLNERIAYLKERAAELRRFGKEGVHPEDVRELWIAKA